MTHSQHALLPSLRALPADPWSIGLYAGDTVLSLRPLSGITQPILSREDVTDVEASFVADPFVFERHGELYLFLEVMNSHRMQGEIGLATSSDGTRWNYRGIVLAEPFHLSYPHILEHQGTCYMIPETYQAEDIRIYRADPFPARWVFVKVLVPGSHVNASPFFHQGRWWMFACSTPLKHDTLELYYAPDLLGPWQRHPSSPVVRGDPRSARPAGRVVATESGLVRFAQDCSSVYGRCVRAFRILRIDESHYEEAAVSPDPLLEPTGEGWNGRRMHHVDAHRRSDGRWWAWVDGRG